ncbi:hypothetical protein [Dietzia sp. UBA5065]|jgi:hypothetical protein|uniref:hypothetical protein n=1 Tax=Dietzia sp. UBA5065 TaxID=1946422 RepID=UPI0025BFA08F|nr:hypothetical protein [Dietzia sp. UBA5065]HMT49249.1 hypothetical protein [Dietzia sp.]
MNGSGHRATLAGVVAAVALVMAACGSPQTEEGPEPPGATTSSAASTAASSTVTVTSGTSPTPPPPTQAAPAVETVTEGAECGPRGAVAAFADGATAYCARLQYTDGAAWSRDPNLAPNPAVEESVRLAGPQLGDGCIGADIGRTAVDADGNSILCDNYRWVLNVGQVPRHPWVEEQIKWTECLEEFTEEECRVMLN